MLDIYIKLLPVFGYFGFGIALKYFNLAHHRHGDFLLKFMFFGTLPILVLVKLTQAQLNMDKLYLPFMNIGINLGCVSVMILATRLMQIERGTLGVMLVSSLILNNIFLFPFILTVFGDQAFADLVIFDIGNAITAVTLAYVVAFSYGSENLKLVTIFLNVLKLPAVWALIVAVTLNLHSIHLPDRTIDLLEPVGLLTSPLILISLGIYFTPRIKKINLVAITVFIRMFIGLIIGVTIATVFDLHGSGYKVVVLCSAAPIGFNALTFSSLAKLDVGFAASVVSTSILLALITVPVLMYFLQT